MNTTTANAFAAPTAPFFRAWFRRQTRATNRHPLQISGVRRSTYEIAKKETVTITQAQGTVIECLDGSVWVTMDNDPRDVILDAGQSFRADSNQRLLVHALDAARVRVIG